MNTNPKAKRILCFGDSNTWGYIPGQAKRYGPDLRWTGILQKLLGEEFEIIEEGLNGRTTVIDDDQKPGRNGENYLLPCLLTHDPIDYLILFLGTNDMKERYNQTPSDIASNIEKLIKLIYSTAFNQAKNSPNILLISPTIIDESVEGVQEKYKGAESKSRSLGVLYEEISKQYDLQFIDLAEFVKLSKVDGYHFDRETHQQIAKSFYEKIMQDFQTN